MRLLGAVDGAARHDAFASKTGDGRFEEVKIEFEVAVESANQDLLCALLQAPLGIAQDDFFFGSSEDQMTLSRAEGHDDGEVRGGNAGLDGAGRRCDAPCGVTARQFDAGGPAAGSARDVTRGAADDLKFEGAVHRRQGTEREGRKPRSRTTGDRLRALAGSQAYLALVKERFSLMRADLPVRPRR